MKITTARTKLLDEIAKIPDEKVYDIYKIIYYFRLGLQAQKSDPKRIMRLAGSWNDMSESEFNDFLTDIQIRRQTAFSSRRNHETSLRSDN